MQNDTLDTIAILDKMIKQSELMIDIVSVVALQTKELIVLQQQVKDMQQEIKDLQQEIVAAFSDINQLYNRERVYKY